MALYAPKQKKAVITTTLIIALCFYLKKGNAIRHPATTLLYTKIKRLPGRKRSKQN